MKSERPRFRRVYVEARDAETKRRVCTTMYDCTPEQVIDRLKEAGSEPESKPQSRKRAAQPA